jgi:hypothetical protein
MNLPIQFGSPDFGYWLNSSDNVTNGWGSAITVDCYALKPADCILCRIWMEECFCSWADKALPNQYRVLLLLTIPSRTHSAHPILHYFPSMESVRCVILSFSRIAPTSSMTEEVLHRSSGSFAA